jgi:hypothetical protein
MALAHFMLISGGTLTGSGTLAMDMKQPTMAVRLQPDDDPGVQVQTSDFSGPNPVVEVLAPVDVISGGPAFPGRWFSVVAKRAGTVTLEARKRRDDDSYHCYVWPLIASIQVTVSDLMPGDMVKVGGKKYVIYDDEVRSGGSIAWICRNPGNIRNGDPYGAFRGKKFDAGTSGKFAIFPDEATGFAAIIPVLKGYGHITILQCMEKYAPRGDGANDPDRYAATVAGKLGVGVETFLDSLTDAQLQAVRDQIKVVEGWIPGTTFKRDDANLPDEIKRRLLP